MRTIDELGISKTPWNVENKGVFVIDSVNDANGEVITGVIDTPNAHIIAAAPELYEALYDLVSYGEAVLDWDTAPTHIKASVMLKIKTAKNALAKASGEEVK